MRKYVLFTGLIVENDFKSAVLASACSTDPSRPACRAHGDTPPGLRYPDDAMLTPTDQASRATEVIDAGAIAAELAGLVDVHAGNERELRLAVSRRLKAALVDGRAAAERLLIKDRHGRRCAERLCFML